MNSKTIYYDIDENAIKYSIDENAIAFSRSFRFTEFYQNRKPLQEIKSKQLNNIKTIEIHAVKKSKVIVDLTASQEYPDMPPPLDPPIRSFVPNNSAEISKSKPKTNLEISDELCPTQDVPTQQVIYNQTATQSSKQVKEYYNYEYAADVFDREDGKISDNHADNDDNDDVPATQDASTQQVIYNQTATPSSSKQVKEYYNYEYAADVFDREDGKLSDNHADNDDNDDVPATQDFN